MMEVGTPGRQGKRDRFFFFFFFKVFYEGKKGDFGDRKRELRDIILISYG